MTESFASFVNEMHAQLSELKSSINNGNSIEFQEFNEKYSVYYDQLKKMYDLADNRKKREMMKIFQSHPLHALLIEAPILNRAFSKPLGYAGDYEMMNQLYRNTFEGKNKFSQYIHKFSTEIKAAEAVRKRVDNVYSHIKEAVKKCNENGKKARIMNLACGPAREICKFLLENPGADVEFTCIDQDKNALENARKNINSNKAVFVKEDVKNFIMNINNHHYANQDLIYSAGLYDYLPDGFAQKLTTELSKLLNKNGRILIGNFNQNNPDRHCMELMASWFLLHRSDDELVNFTRELGGKFLHKIETDKTGINSFLIIDKE